MVILKINKFIARNLEMTTKRERFSGFYCMRRHTGNFARKPLGISILISEEKAIEGKKKVASDMGDQTTNISRDVSGLRKLFTEILL